MKKPGKKHYIKEWRLARGVTQDELGAAIGREKSTVSRLERDQSDLTGNVLEKIAEKLGVHPGALFTAPPSGTSPVSVGRIAAPPLALDRPPTEPTSADPTSNRAVFHELPRDVPILGVAAGAMAGAVLLTEGPVDWAKRPPALFGIPDVYAIYIRGDSMEPAHRDGELCFVHPHRPARPGDTVVLQTKASDHKPVQTWIKRLRKMSDANVVVEQFNPPATHEFRRSAVVSIHKVLTTNELFGV